MIYQKKNRVTEFPRSLNPGKAIEMARHMPDICPITVRFITDDRALDAYVSGGMQPLLPLFHPYLFAIS